MSATQQGLLISALARQGGTNPPTIRYYEQIGLLRPPIRNAAGHRLYSSADVARLTFIRRCRAFGFPIERVKMLARLLDDTDRSCMEARDLAEAQLAEVRTKLSELKSLETTLDAFVTQCNETCEGGPGPDCDVLQELTQLQPRNTRPKAKRPFKRTGARTG
ncbi:MAG: MerR family transcriptional regulator [Methyloligellaceae bacterium]